jgi:hypothetical protein
MVGQTLVLGRTTIVLLIRLESIQNYPEAAFRVAELAAWRTIEGMASSD